MKENKNAHPAVAAAGQASGNADSNFRNDFTSNQTFGQFRISGFLSVGQENAVSLQQLQGWTGLDGRVIRKMIAAERFNGIPILADNQTGYYLPATEAERKRCVQSMQHRAKEIYRAAQAIESADITQSATSHRHPIAFADVQTMLEGWF